VPTSYTWLPELAARYGLYAVRSERLCEWWLFERNGERHRGRISDHELVRRDDFAQRRYVTERCRELVGEMHDLYALRDEAQVASRGRGE